MSSDKGGEAVQAAAVGIMKELEQQLSRATDLDSSTPRPDLEDWRTLGRTETGHAYLQIVICRVRVVQEVGGRK